MPEKRKQAVAERSKMVSENRFAQLFFCLFLTLETFMDPGH